MQLHHRLVSILRRVRQDVATLLSDQRQLEFPPSDN
jgi:hypothetical protein